ncbi:MAG: MBL fold metallo-hydrolase [Ferruginibacter sp.]
MSLFVTSLNSGSNGNCYYIGNNTEAVLIDAGISCRETEKRMKLLGLSMNKLKAIFVSHEHTDHIKGVPALSDKFSLPVYITSSTLKGCCEIKRESTKSLLPYVPVTISGLTITAFPKKHDAEDPHSFTISGNGITVGVFTDIGSTCKHVIENFGQCNAAFLEANYDVDLLENGNYPYFLKNRIRGGNGHLSNKEALEIFKSYRSPLMSHLFLSHLSKNNNCPVIAKNLFDEHAGQTKIIVASRYEQTAVYVIKKETSNSPAHKSENLFASKQLSLF